MVEFFKAIVVILCVILVCLQTIRVTLTSLYCTVYKNKGRLCGRCPQYTAAVLTIYSSVANLNVINETVELSGSMYRGKHKFTLGNKFRGLLRKQY